MDYLHRGYPNVRATNIAPGPLAHGAEAFVEVINGEAVFQFRLKAPVLSQISPLLTQTQWNEIDRDIENASSFDLNIRNLEKPWEEAFTRVLNAFAQDESGQLLTKSQFTVWRFKADGDNEKIVNLERSVRGKKGQIKELIPDLATVLRLTLPGDHYEFVAIIFAELKRAISRQYTCHLDPQTQQYRMSYLQIPNSLEGAGKLRYGLEKARRQVERQALLQHCVYSSRYGRTQPEIVPILSRKMVLLAVVGPWFMVARQADCTAAWQKLRRTFPNDQDTRILELFGRKEDSSDDVDPEAEDPEETAPEKLIEDIRRLLTPQPQEPPFDFSVERINIARVVRRRATFEWDAELFNVREKRGWTALEEIKKQVCDDIALFCNDKGEMIAMSVDIRA